MMKVSRQLKVTKIIKKSFFLLFLVVSCYRVPDKIEPQLSCLVSDRYLQSLPSPFPMLSIEEEKQDWAKEYRIALYFAKNLDLYRAISTFKRAEALMGKENRSRLLEISYSIFLCYYLGEKYQDAIETVENSILKTIDPSFPAFSDFLILLHSAYKKIGEEKKAIEVLTFMESIDPATAKKISFIDVLSQGDPKIIWQQTPPNYKKEIDTLLQNYSREKVSIPKAQLFNALLPGSGYLYLGQKRSALTAFLLNSLFIAASYEFFHRGYIAAGIITTSFEMGWYFGCIYGAGESAKYYNERIFEKEASNFLCREKLFPLFMIQYGF